MSATVTGDYTIGSAVASSLLTDLIAFWKLEEASGTRYDSVGNNDLSDNNTVTQAAGKVGYAAQFTGVNIEWLSITDNTDLSTGDIDFTFALWVYFITGGTKGVLGKDNGTDREYGIWLSNNVVEFYVFDSGGNYVPQLASTFGALSTDTWYFIATWHDSVTNTINIQINNGTVDTRSHTLGVRDQAADFRIGRQADTYMDGYIDAVGFWKRVLTADERTALFNSGSGVEYPF